jgi:hypothetical protein
MRLQALGVLLAMIAGPALAFQAPSATTSGKDAGAQEASQGEAKRLYVCDKSELTRRGFAREFGSAEFVDAKAAVAAPDAWSAPRCITATEAKRLKRMKLATR